MVDLTTGLSDLSKELGETNTNTNTRRIQHYNDAVIDFFNERKWPFAIKKNSTLLTTSGAQDYAIPAAVLADWRAPGGIKEITIGDGNTPILPIAWEDRGNSAYSNGNFFYLDPEETRIYFKEEVTAGEAVNIYYYHIPARIEDIEDEDEFPVPDRYRKAVALLAGAYVQWSRYLEQQGNRLYNLYTKQVKNITGQQAERNQFAPRRLPHFLAHRGFRRRYP